MLKRILVLLFLICSFCFSQEKSFFKDVDVDSLTIYYDLIAEENYDSHYGPNVAGMVIGGLFTGAGTFFLVGGLTAINYTSDKDEPIDAASDEIFTHIAGAGLFIISIPFYLVGIPILSYNTYKFAVRKGHANRRDEYIDALERYKRQQETNSVQWMLVPSVNLANAGGGLNLLVAF